MSRLLGKLGIVETRLITAQKFTTSAWSGGPPATPNDGDIWIATAVTAGGERWMFQYDSAWVTDANKWKYLGGDPVEIADDGTVATTSATYAIPAAGSGAQLSWTAGRSGVYKARHNGTAAINASVLGSIGLNFAGSGTNLAGITPNGSATNVPFSGEKTGAIGAGSAVQPVYAIVGGNTITVSTRQLIIAPMRIS